MSIQYRPDIDGLRALAVISVVLSHANYPYITGGFIGVDVFFVISGYLITLILLNDLQNESFNILTFLARRIKRIVPALTVMIIFCSVIGWFLFLPEDYKNLGNQTLSNSLFISNILFYLQAGYFDISNENKPLLHTWSLAVEEQFYLLYPFILFFLWNLKYKIKLFYILFFALLLSLGLSIYGTYYHPSATFYLLPTRAWEMLLGALITQIYAPKNLKKSHLNYLGILGLFMIIYPILSYDSKTLFPGLNALLPCAGAGILIWIGTNKTSIISKILSIKSVVFIGLISYSWYLWHWPFISFTKYYFYDEVPPFILFISVATSFIIAILSWKFIEKPFRLKSKSEHKQAVIIFVTFFAICSTIFILTNSNLFLKTFKTSTLQYAEGATDINPRRKQCHHLSVDEMSNGKLCKHNDQLNVKPSFVSFGDSFSTTIDQNINNLATKFSVSGIQASYSSCPPLLGIYRKAHIKDSYNYSCYNFNNFIYNYVKENKIQNVILFARWSAYFEEYPIYKTSLNDNSHYIFQKYFLESINFFKKHNVQVWIITQPAESNLNIPYSLAKADRYNHDTSKLNIPRDIFDKQNKNMSPILDIVKKDNQSFSHVKIIDLSTILCDESECMVSDNGFSLYRDAYHLSQKGATTIEHLLEPIFESYKNDNNQ